MLRGSFLFVFPMLCQCMCCCMLFDVSGLSICIVLRAFVVVISMCLLYVSLGSS